MHCCAAAANDGELSDNSSVAVFHEHNVNMLVWPLLLYISAPLAQDVAALDAEAAAAGVSADGTLRVSVPAAGTEDTELAEGAAAAAPREVSVSSEAAARTLVGELTVAAAEAQRAAIADRMAALAAGERARALAADIASLSRRSAEVQRERAARAAALVSEVQRARDVEAQFAAQTDALAGIFGTAAVAPVPASAGGALGGAGADPAWR